MHVHDLKAIDKCLRHLMLGSKILKCIISMQQPRYIDNHIICDYLCTLVVSLFMMSYAYISTPLCRYFQVCIVPTIIMQLLCNGSLLFYIITFKCCIDMIHFKILEPNIKCRRHLSIAFKSCTCMLVLLEQNNIIRTECTCMYMYITVFTRGMQLL